MDFGNFPLTPAGIQAAADDLDRRRAKARGAPKHSRCGVIISTPIGGGRPTTSDLVKCVHCDYIWIWAEGSGIMRAFCQRCGGWCCCRPFCLTLGCTSPEQRLWNMENGKSFDYRPVIVTSGFEKQE